MPPIRAELHKEEKNVMNQVRLGKTGIVVNKNGFGALPIQRIPKEEAVKLVRKAYDNGIRFLTPHTPTRTARRSWGRPLRESGTRSISPPRRPPRTARISGSIWRRA